MSQYRLYFLNAASGHIEAVRDIEASDDADAIEAAQALVADRPVEIWSGTRKIGRYAARAERLRYERAAEEYQRRGAAEPASRAKSR